MGGKRGWRVEEDGVEVGGGVELVSWCAEWCEGPEDDDTEDEDGEEEEEEELDDGAELDMALEVYDDR